MSAPTYTQHTVGWPDQPLLKGPAAYDDINISTEDKGEFSITFYRFGSPVSAWKKPNDHYGCKIEFFGDGYQAFRMKRFQRVLDRWARLGSKRDEATPELWIAWLETEGFVASDYHQRPVTHRREAAQ